MPIPSEPLLGLSSGLLPIHLKPCSDELLSSWIIRLAHAHGLKLQTFCALIFGRDRSIWNRDIDKQAPDWLLTRLSEVTSTPFEIVLKTTLRSYEGHLYEHHQPNGNTRWILPLGVYHRIHRNPGLLCCPTCLADDETPYFRRSWRLAFSVACTKHCTWLIALCPQCNSFIEPHRSDMQSRDLFPIANQLTYCWHCGYDLRRPNSTHLPSTSLLEFQLRIETALKQGYLNWADNPSMYSHIFFDGLRSLITGLTSRHSIERLNKSEDARAITLSSWPKMGFEFSQFENRKLLINWLSQLLQVWPEHFQSLIRSSKLRYADMKGDSDSRPYWLESIIKGTAGGGFPIITEDEVSSITHSVENKYGQFSLTKAREFSGRDLSNHVSKFRPVSDDVYEDLLTSIDHQIAGTLDKTERDCLIRDKIMFAAGRLLGLSEGALSKLTLTQVRELAPESAALDFSEVARHPSQARAWVEWYWDNMRPNLQPEPHVPEIFTSIVTMRGIKHSTVGRRFQQAVQWAMMQSVIRTYGAWHA